MIVKRKSLALHDKDSKFMKVKKESGFFYNVQEVVDGNHFVIGLGVSTDANDYNQFITMYEQASENVGGLPEDCEVLADNGL